MKHHRLSDADIVAVSIVRKGANRKTVFLKKEHAPEAEMIEMPGARTLIKSSDAAGWSRFYCVVAEPDAPEDPGVLAKDQSIPDVWDEDEIRKAQASFVKNGGLINKMHESLDPYGALVENAIALADFTVNGETIRKGSWYIAVEPNDEGRAAIDKGEFTGVSIQGTANRTLVDKGAHLDVAKVEEFTKPGIANVSASDRKKLGPLLAHYAAQAHPFGSCKRDQMKHGLSEDHANRRCAVLKQLIGVRKAKVAKGMGNGDAPWSDDVAKALDRVEMQAAMLKCDVAAFAPLFEDEIAKAKPFTEQLHPRKGGKFAPKGTATVAARGGGKPANTAPGTSPQDQGRANRLHTASNILATLGFKGQKLGDALKEFQKQAGIPVTGEVDPQTMTALRAQHRAKVKGGGIVGGGVTDKPMPPGHGRRKAPVFDPGKQPVSAKRRRRKVAKADFNPADHPRDPVGRFAAKLSGLKAGESVSLPGGVTVKRLRPGAVTHGSGTPTPGQHKFAVSGGGVRSDTQRSAEQAARAAIHRSGKAKKKSIDEQLGLKPDGGLSSDERMAITQRELPKLYREELKRMKPKGAGAGVYSGSQRVRARSLARKRVMAMIDAADAKKRSQSNVKKLDPAELGAVWA